MIADPLTGEVRQTLMAPADGCINRCEFAICTEKTCHSIGDFPPPRRITLPPKSSAGNPTDRARRY